EIADRRGVARELGMQRPDGAGNRAVHAPEQLARKSPVALAFPFRSADIGAGGWRGASPPPTRARPGGRSPHTRRVGALVSLPLNLLRLAEVSRPGAAGTMNDATTPDDPNAPGLGLVTPERAPHYRVLARKYRPASFDDLIGQDAMVRTISNAFETGR